MLPDSVGGPYDAYIEAASFRLRNLRAIGDAAPGDERTTLSDLTVGWGNEASAPTVLFDEAPLGLYSQISAEITQYTITGTVNVNNTVYPFQIIDIPPVAISTTTSLSGVMVVAGEITTVVVELQVKDIVKELDWDGVSPNGDGVLVVDGNDINIGEIRDDVSDLFDIPD